MSHLIETVGRQSSAWAKTESIIELMAGALTAECLASPDCIDKAISEVTTLRANVDKESQEIENLWVVGTVSEDFASFYNDLDYKNQLIIDRVLDQYFPEEGEELDTPVKLL